MRLAPSLLAVLLLPGCADVFGHCGLHPDHVSWRDPDFPDALLDAAPEWSVRVVDAPPGIPNDDPALAAWNATVQRVSVRLDAGAGDVQGHHGHATLSFHPDGRLHLGETTDPEPPSLHGDVLAALARVTDGNASERAAWADGLLAHRTQVAVGFEDGREVPYYAYEASVPPERVRIDGLLEGNLTQPMQRVVAGDWRIALAFPAVEATRGAQAFTAHLAGDNVFQDAAWQGEFPEEEALADFRAAYESLGVGAPPEDAGVGGAIC